MENKTRVIVAVQPNSESANGTLLEWAKPQLSPLGISDGTNGKAPYKSEITTGSGAHVGSVLS
jgi:hypothetical protein